MVPAAWAAVTSVVGGEGGRETRGRRRGRDSIDFEFAKPTLGDRDELGGRRGHVPEDCERVVRTISLDAFTADLLRRYLTVLDEERDAFGAGYDTSHHKLMRYEDGRRLHADTITRRFNHLVDLAGVRRIRLHDIRHTHATLSLDSGVHAKIVSDRIGHAHEGITVQIYGHRSTGHDREAAELVAGLIRSRLADGPAASVR